MNVERQDIIPVSEQVEVIYEFSRAMLDNIKDTDPEFSALVDDQFWDLV